MGEGKGTNGVLAYFMTLQYLGIILKPFFQKYDGVMWIRFIWLRTGISGWLSICYPISTEDIFP
jgi:hypothetical protein